MDEAVITVAGNGMNAAVTGLPAVTRCNGRVCDPLPTVAGGDETVIHASPLAHRDGFVIGYDGDAESRLSNIISSCHNYDS